MSQLEEIGQLVSIIASDLTKHANELHIFSTRLRQSAGEAAAVGRDSTQSGANGAMRAAQSLTEAANRCTQAAQQLLSGGDAARQFVSRHIGPGGNVNEGVPASRGFPPLDAELQNLLTTSSFEFSKGPGRFFLAPNDVFRNVAPYMPSVNDDSYLAMVHGTPNFVEVGDKVLSAEQFAALIQSDPNYKNGQSVTLFSCSTGLKDDGFAAQLARILGARVTAPTSLAWLPPEPDGSVLVTPMDSNEDPIRNSNGGGLGGWRTFG